MHASMKSFFLLLFTSLSACLRSLSEPTEKRTPRIRLSHAAAANKASQNNRSIPRGQKSLFPTKCEGGQESRLREGREICFHVCLLSVLLILAIFIVKPEIRAVLGVCHDALPLILDGTAISQAH
jgi:hypothetical protein